MKTLPILIAASLLAACGGESPAHETQPVQPEATRTVTGLEVIRNVALDGEVLSTTPSDFHDTLFEAHVPDGDGYRVVPGYGRRDGTFEIPGVPEGDYWLRIARRPAGDDYVWTDTSEIDYSGDSLGPEDPPRAETESFLAFVADGLDAWQEGDTLSFYGPDDVLFENDLSMSATEGAPVPGATALAGMKVSWLGRPLVDLGEGETAVVVQFRAGENEQGVAYTAPIRSYTPAPVAQQDGETASITGTFAEPPVLDFHLAWNRAAFEELRSSVHPTLAGPSDSHELALFATPLAGEQSLGWAPQYTLFGLGDPSLLEGTDPLDLGAFSFPNPYPASWVISSWAATFPVDLPFPGGETFPMQGVVAVRTRHLPAADAPVLPGIGPVVAPRLDGADADAQLSDVAPMPVLSFEPPRIGTATHYLVQVIEALPAPPEPYRPGWYLSANLWLPGDVTEVRIPEDVLRHGSTYVLLIRAIDEAGADIRHHPSFSGVESALADRFTSPFTVAAE